MFKRTLGIAVVVIVGAVLVSASSAATTKAQTAKKIDVSTRAAVVNYLRSIHVSAKHVVIERGLRNYAGAHCPGKGWTCAGTRHTVVQIAKQRGLNRYACSTAKCAVVQLASGSVHAVSSASNPKPPPNVALCVKTTGVTQSCLINQPNASGTNQAVVWMVTPKDTGLTQSAYYSASITQGPASAAGSTNANVACVKQSVWLDGSTTKTNSTSTTVTNDNHESITIKQNSLIGTNSVQGVSNPSTGVYNCDATLAPQLQQDEVLTSIVNSKGSITQNQDTLPSTTSCDPYDANVSGCANVVTDVEQNQASGFKGSASGLNMANFEQSTNQIAIANTPSGTVTQQQNADVPNPPYSGVVGTINQDSTAQSTAIVTQKETQCQDAVNVSTPIPSPTTPASAVCPNNPDSGVPGGVTLKQTQYGPLGVVGAPSKKGANHFHTKGYGQSQQTNAGPTVHDQFKLTQTSSQNQDVANPPRITTLQKNTIKGDCASSGDNSATGGACVFSQSATLNGVTSGVTTDGYTAGQIGGTGAGAPPPLVISCSNGHSTCQPTPPPAPVIDAGSKPAHVIEAGTGSTTFTWTDLAKNNTVNYECSPDNSTWTPCSSGDANAQFANTTAGDYNFYVRAVDSSGNRSTADSWSWSVVDANISISPSSPVDEVGNARTFTVTVNAIPAGATPTSFADPVITETPVPGQQSSTACDPNTIQVNGNQLTCSVTINSAAAGTFTVKASDQVTMGGVQVTRTTSDGAHSDGASAVENYVDANIAISPLTPVNVVGNAETFTVTVTASPAGATPTSFADLVISETPKPDLASGTGCDANTKQINGNVLTCSVTINSDQAGTFNVQASDQVTMGGVTVTRTTGDNAHGDSVSAVKTYVLPTPVIDPLSEPADGTASTNADFLFSDSDSSVMFVCSQDGVTYTTCSPNAGPGSGEQTYSGLAVGPQNFYVEATDGTNQSAPASYSWNIAAAP